MESDRRLTAGLLLKATRGRCEARYFLGGEGGGVWDELSSPQDVTTLQAAVSMYRASNALLHPLAEEYRKSGMFVRIGIPFNYSGALRPEWFVTRKITAVATNKATYDMKG